jgi:hypothetical protein
MPIDVGSLGEDRVEVRCDDQVGPCGLAGTHADDVPDAVAADFLEAGLLEEALELAAARLLFEWRRRDLANARLQVEYGGLVALRGFERGAHRRLLEQLGGSLGEGERRGDARQQKAADHLCSIGWNSARTAPCGSAITDQRPTFSMVVGSM